ncbi:MAG: PilZ domain-containing protein [Acidobacteriota bacterium]
MRTNSKDEGTGRRELQRRSEPRIRPSRPLDVELLGTGRSTVQGRILDISANGLSALVSNAVTAGTPVKIETEEELLLAEVCYCRPQEGAFRMGMIVKHRIGASPASGVSHSSAINRSAVNQRSWRMR